MAKAKVSIGTYREQSGTERVTYVKEGTIKMAANPVTPSPDESYAGVTAAAVAANTAYETWVATPTKANKTLYNDALKDMDTKFVVNMNYCSRMADGSVAIIEALGLTATPSSYASTPVPNTVVGVKLTVPAEPTKLIINSTHDKLARGIITILTTDPNAFLVFNGNMFLLNSSIEQVDTRAVVSSSTKVEVQGLMSNMRYYVHRFAFNQTGYGGVSVKVSAVVQ